MKSCFEITKPAELMYSTSDPALNILLGNLKQYALDNNVTFQTGIFIDKHYMKSADICSLIQNIVMNAIEATCKLDIPYRKVQLKLNYIPGGLNIECYNHTMKNTDLNLFSHTSKKDKKNHGIGLKIIESIIKKI